MNLSDKIIDSLKPFSRLVDKYYFLTIYIIAKNNISRQYRDSFLGVLWTLIQPASQVAIYSFIMPKILQFRSAEYLPFLISSLLPWHLMYAVLTGTPNSLIYQAETLKRCLVSKTVFPLADVLRYSYTFVLSFAVMYVIALILYIDFDPTILLLPIYMLPILVILGSLSIALSHLTPYVKDLPEVMVVGMNVTFWLTPIVYPVTAFPEHLRFIFNFNPFYVMMRPVNILVQTQTLPDLDVMTPLFFLMTFAVMGSYMIYNKCRKNFVYYL